MEPQRWERVTALFEASVKLPEQERRSFLEERCNGDTGLIREVLELIGTDSWTGRYMEPPGHTDFRRAATGEVAEDLTGERLGPYQLEGVIGRGGMGAVYRARRVDAGFEQEVAIKLIRRGMDTDDILQRFQNERQVLADLVHPGIARLLDGGATDDGRPYLVMEIVDGRPIDRYCEARGLDVEQRLRLFQKVCAAVSHAHERRVVHRDLKPSNILVTSEGEPKLLDFGIAKLVDATGSVRTVDVTATELRLMTPEYASPEQVRSGRVDVRSDVYALGVVLYELLTGRRPYAITTGLRSDLERAICEEDPIRPSRTTDSRRERTRLSGDLDTVVLKALRKEPERRYASARELADDIQRHLSGHRVLARPDTWRYRTAKFVRRNRVLVASTVVVFLVLVAGLIGTSSMFLEAESERAEGLVREYVARIAAAASSLRADDGAGALRHLTAAPVEHRGWEWRYLRARADTSERTLLGHDASLALAWSPDGRILATGGQGQRALLWDAETGQELERWENLGGTVLDLAFSPDGERLVATVGRRLHMLELGRGEPAWTKKMPAELVVFHPDGERLAVGRRDRSIELIDVSSGSEVGFLPVDGIPSRGFSFSPDGRSLLFGLVEVGEARPGFDETGSVHVWDLPAESSRVILSGSDALEPDHEINAIRLISDGRRFVTGDSAGRIRVWGVSTGALELEIASGSSVSSLAVAPDGRWIVSAHADRAIRTWDAASGAPQAVRIGHESPILSLGWSPTGERFASGGRDASVKLWRTSGETDAPILGDRGWNMALAVAPDGDRIAVGAWDAWRGAEAGAAVRDLPTGAGVWRALHEIPPARGNDGNALALAWSPNGRWLASCARDRNVRIWDARTGAALGSWAVDTERWVSLSFSPDSKTLFTAQGKHLRAWDIEGGERAPFPVSDIEIRDLAIDASGARLATAGGEGVDLWNVANRFLERKLVHDCGGLLALAFHPLGGQLATAGRDGSVRLWRLPEGTFQVLEGHAGSVIELAYSPDGTRLVSASEDTTLKLWDPADGRELLTLHGHDEAVAQVAFTPDGERIVSQDRDGVIRVWHAPPVERAD